MTETTRVRWLVLVLALAVMLAVAGSALGATSEAAEPLVEPPTATNTPDPYAPPPTATLDPSITPSATPTATATPYPLGSVYGVVVDTTGAPMAGAQITFTRTDWADQTYALLGQMTTGADGRFWFAWDCSMDTVRLEMAPPGGYQGVSAELSPGEYGMIWDAYRMDFAGEYDLKVSGPFRFTIEPIPPTPDIPPGVTPTWTRSAFNTGETGLPGRIWVSHAEAQAGETVQVGFYSTAYVGASATIRFDPALLTAVDMQGNATNRAVSHWPAGTVLLDSIDNTSGVIRISVGHNSYGDYPLATYRFLALQAGWAVLDIVDGSQMNFGSPMTWGNFGADDGLIQIAPAPTATPTATPTRTPAVRIHHGTVLDAAGAPVRNAQLTLSRDNNGVWTQSATGPSGSDGVFRLWTNPIPGTYKLVMQPPAGYTGSSAALPVGVTGEVVTADTLTFTLDNSAGQVGPFSFEVAAGPTPVPTLPPVVLSGHVTLAGQPLADVMVTLSSGGLSAVQTTTTDAEGYYAFVASPGVYTLSVHDPASRIPDREREIDTDVVEPGPIDWGNWYEWLPLVWMAKA